MKIRRILSLLMAAMLIIGIMPAAAGETVSISIAPNSGYGYICTVDPDDVFSEEDDSFVMPYRDVTVKVDFLQISVVQLKCKEYKDI